MTIELQYLRMIFQYRGAMADADHGSSAACQLSIQIVFIINIQCAGRFVEDSILGGGKQYVGKSDTLLLTDR
jgi:hypothetical protein